MNEVKEVVSKFHKITKKEIAILDWLQEHVRSDALDVVMPLITKLGSYGIVWIIIIIYLWTKKKYRKDGLILAVALIIGLLIGNITLKPLIRRTRPYDVNTAFELLIPEQVDFSFPSGHSLSSFAAATVLFLTNKKLGIPAIMLASSIAFSRLYLYVHYLSDVVGGSIMGIVIGYATVKCFYRKNSGYRTKKRKMGKG